jgi:hypothetical protein
LTWVDALLLMLMAFCLGWATRALLGEFLDRR